MWIGEEILISEFRDEKSCLKYVGLTLETLSPGYFLKVGKRLEGKVLVYWVMVPIEKELSES